MKALLSLALLNFCLLIASAAEPPTVHGAIMADRARAAALLAADTNALHKILADDFRYTHSNGYLESKAMHIKSFKDGLRYTRFQTTNVVGHVITPDVVVLTGKIDQSKGKDGKMTDFQLLFQGVWRKKSNDWQLVSLQTAVPPAKP